MLLMCFIFQRGLIPRAKETLVTLIYLYTDAGHPSPYDTDLLHVLAGPHTLSQGDPGDPDILVYPDAGHPSPYVTDVCCMFQRGLIPRAKETLVTCLPDA
jgi:hypothetical protein